MGSLIGGLFGSKKPEAIKMPKPPPPPAIPEVGPEAGDFAARMARRRRGFLGTIKAGALEPRTGKKAVLG